MVRNRWISIILALILLITIILPVYASDLSQRQLELQELSRQREAQQNQLNATKIREKSMLDQIQEVERSILATEKEITQIKNRISYLNNSIKETEAAITQLEEELELQSEILGDRLVFIYERGEISYLEVLLEATDIKDLLTRFDMLNMIVEQDLNLIEKISNQRKTLAMKKSDLEVNKRELEIIQAREVEKRQLLSAQKSEKQTILGSVQAEKEQYERAVRELEQASKELETIIRNLQRGDSPAQGTGVYTWPTPGYTTITSNYGMRYHPILRQQRMHTGVDIGAPSGARIVAADSGSVIFTGWMGGYGQVVIIDHGQGISTLYAHMSSISIANGAAVTRGQTIGRVGSTGWSTGPHLHFEVRKNGNPIDPRQYI